MEGRERIQLQMFLLQRRSAGIFSVLRRGIFHSSASVLPDGLDRRSDLFLLNSSASGDLLTELRSHIEKVGKFSTLSFRL